MSFLVAKIVFNQATICHLLNPTSTNLILSPFLLKLSLIFSVFPLLGSFYRPHGLSPALLTENKKIYLETQLHPVFIAKTFQSLQYAKNFADLHGYISSCVVTGEDLQHDLHISNLELILEK